MRIKELFPPELIVELGGLTEDDEVSLPEEEAPNHPLLSFRYKEDTNDDKCIITVFDRGAPPSGKYVRVNDVRRCCALCYAKAFCQGRMPDVIGITGTNGKTTTAYLLSRIMTDCGKKVGFIGTGAISVNGSVITDRYYSYTTPPPEILYPAIGRMIKEGCDLIVMEVSSHAIAQKRIEGLSFRIGIFTNLSPEHTDYHSSMEEYFKLKQSFVASCQRSVYCMDDAYSRRSYEENKENAVAVGVIRRRHIYATDITSLGLEGWDFTYAEKGVFKRIVLRLPGAYNLYNALQAMAAARLLGANINSIAASLNEIGTVPGRAETIHTDRTIIIDYAHTPGSFDNILKTLYSKKNAGQKLVTVFGCGGNRDRAKRKKMGSIAEKYSDIIILTSDNLRGESFDQITSDILQGIKKREKAIIIEDRRRAIETVMGKNFSGCIIALLGKGAERYMINNGRYSDFCERDIIEEYVRGKMHNEN